MKLYLKDKHSSNYYVLEEQYLPELEIEHYSTVTDQERIKRLDGIIKEFESKKQKESDSGFFQVRGNKDEWVQIRASGSKNIIKILDLDFDEDGRIKKRI